ncbi:hypothetical protein [Streptomyces sulfonofaciens]|nr:hypothetical protein [Streptomyces sulfonofaciens]
MSHTKIGAALVGGYLLGRTKKAKMAIGLGMFLAGKKLKLDPKQLGSMLAESPLLAGLDGQVRKELLDSTKSAATSALSHRIGRLADSLHQRTLALDGKGEEPEERGHEDDVDPEDHDGDAADRGEEREEPDTEVRSHARTASRPGAQASSGGRTASTSPARTSGRAHKRASGASRTASGGTKKVPSEHKATAGAAKTTPRARKAASGTARRASKRGGSNA